MTVVFTHPVFGEHETPPGHAEQRARYAAALRGLSAGPLADLERREAPLAERGAILRAHDEAYVAKLEAASPREGSVQLDPDTHMGPHSLDAARRGAGAAVAAVEAVMSGEAQTAFVASRPPGHHAVANASMGFCLFNNVVVAARHAQAACGAERVAVVDFDVHHGNGTQDLLWDDENAFFASSHEYPQWPGTGAEDERGAHGQVHNARLLSGSGPDAFRLAWAERLLPALDTFAPDLIVVSAGFDAHEADPLGGLNLTESDFAWITGEIVAVAKRHASGRVVSILEGGYDLGALERSVAAHVSGLAGLSDPR
ncbi:histone deacetylase family protein [Parvularcula dongshanensis]|uniref:Acetoin utilization deacetylase AcuC-like enzyme n=1 Tax=Parvularcula dongshanensis TaxID=1173995 RepID=A0A840I4U9_9PROT|nr:acetoin utilization deacetylase AcuC-like enzyme [Parvularcula dongshanensis]